MKKRRLVWLCLTAAALLMLWPALPDALPADAAAVIPVDEEKYVALTFDDGPRADTTAALLDGLRERGASATFFLVGEQIAGKEALVVRMAREGHQVGNHTWSHAMLQEAPPETVRQEVGQTETLLEQLLGEGEYWLRPPYGLLTPEQRQTIDVPMAHWMVDPEDWRLRNREKVAEAVLSAVRPGDIILLHDTISESVAAALDIVDALQRQGYGFVTVEELLRLHGTEPRQGVMYRSADAVVTW